IALAGTGECPAIGQDAQFRGGPGLLSAAGNVTGWCRCFQGGCRGFGSLRRMPPELRGVDSVLAEQVIERRPGDSEKLRRARKLPLGRRECLAYRLRLGALP